MAAGGSGSRSVGGLAGSGSGPGSAGRQTRAGQRGAPGRSRASGTVRQREGERRRSRWRMEYRGARPVRMAGQRETPGPRVLIPVDDAGDARGARREDVHRVKMSFHFGFATTPGEKRRRFSPRAARFPDAPRPLSPDARSTSNRARRSIVRPRPRPEYPMSTQSRTGYPSSPSTTHALTRALPERRPRAPIPVRIRPGDSSPWTLSEGAVGHLGMSAASHGSRNTSSAATRSLASLRSIARSARFASGLMLVHAGFANSR